MSVETFKEEPDTGFIQAILRDGYVFAKAFRGDVEVDLAAVAEAHGAFHATQAPIEFFADGAKGWAVYVKHTSSLNNHGRPQFRACGDEARWAAGILERFDVGSIVKLKSGGLPMTVLGLPQEPATAGVEVEVMWFGPDGEANRACIDARCLQPAGADEIPF